MVNLAAFQAEPCASSWYGFIVRLGLLVHAWEVHGLLGDRDPFPVVTALALADAKLGRDGAAGNEVG
jgi:prolipoprotein diacylglyceryltransferase